MSNCCFSALYSWCRCNCSKREPYVVGRTYIGCTLVSWNWSPWDLVQLCDCVFLLQHTVAMNMWYSDNEITSHLVSTFVLFGVAITQLCHLFWGWRLRWWLSFHVQKLSEDHVGMRHWQWSWVLCLLNKLWSDRTCFFLGKSASESILHHHIWIMVWVWPLHDFEFWQWLPWATTLLCLTVLCWMFF